MVCLDASDNPLSSSLHHFCCSLVNDLVLFFNVA